MPTKALLPVLCGVLCLAPVASAQHDGHDHSGHDHSKHDHSHHHVRKDEPRSIKVSVDKFDANAHSKQGVTGEIYEFFIFADGQIVRGIEFGAEIEGGELLGYVMDTEKPWASLPQAVAPGTIVQAAAGETCFDPPTLIGKMLVRPNRKNGPVSVHIQTSSLNEAAVLLNCDLSPANGVKAFGAAINADAPTPHDVRGIEIPSSGYLGTVPDTTWGGNPVPKAKVAADK